MASKSNTPGQTISLPQGGGALQGLGETFSPDLQTGTGNLSVPISLPKGRNGLQPQLSLQYSTGNGNGPFGMGWNLSLPGVSRKTASGIPSYDDGTDIFLLSGAEDLVPVLGAPASATRYRPRTEGLFANIDHYNSPQGIGNYWQVQSKDGLLSYYGTPQPPGNDPTWQDPAAIKDPQNSSHLFAWKLTQTIDPFGNRIDYVYERDLVQSEGSHLWDQIYLSEIRYADYGEQSTPEFLVTVKFTYEPRPDHFSSYKSGFEIRTVQRCIRIDIFTNPGIQTAVRTYNLIYFEERGLATGQSSSNGISCISQIQMEGHDGSNSESMPPLEFSYTRFIPQQRAFIPVTGSNLPPASLARPQFELADLLGNGLPDVLEMDGTVRYWRNLGGGRFDLPRTMSYAPGGLQLSDPGVQLLDANGDGRVDLMVTTQQIAGYFPMGFNGLWDQSSFQRYTSAPSFNLQDPEVKLLDLNGDGITDALRSSTRFECFFNDAEAGWISTRQVQRQPLEMFPNVDFSDPRVKWADLSGDGMQDIALVHSGSFAYWPNLGYGNWGRRILMSNSPTFPYGYNPARLLLGDVDGDGLADMVYVNDGQITLWINQSGNSWSDPITIYGTPPVDDMDSVRLVDFLGIGTGGVLWSADATLSRRPNMFFLDFTGGVKPYLLSEMNNHIGSLTRIAYASSTSFYLQDQKQLATQWLTPLPFPVQVVERVESIDQISGGKLTTEYRYHHGYWDGVDHEFRGFGRVDQRDTETFADYSEEGLNSTLPFASVDAQDFSPPTETRCWFHLGPIGDEFGGWYEADFSSEFWPGDPSVLTRPPSMTAFLNWLPRRVKRDAIRALRGRLLRSELYGLDGSVLQTRPYTVTEDLGGIREESPPGPTETGRLHIFFPFDIAQRTTQWERGDDPMSQFSYSDDYDAYGQARAQFSAAVPRGRAYNLAASPGDPTLSPYLATLSRTTYASSAGAQFYCVNRPCRVTSYEVLNDGSSTVFQLASEAIAGLSSARVIGQTYTYYDGLAFEGLAFGQLGNYGAAVRTSSLVLTEELLNQGYRSGDAILSPPEQPPYLATTGAPQPSADYPQAFLSLLPPLAGYVYQPGGPDIEDAAGYFTSTSKQCDFQQARPIHARGLVMVNRDALGNDTTTAYDTPYQLLPVSITDSAGLTTVAEYDYRTLQPSKITDSNGNFTVSTFTPMGLLATSSVVGKAGEGDQHEPSVQREYDFLAFENAKQPISVRTIRRVYHDTQTEVPLPQRNQTIETIEFSDGFGRLVQTRSQAEEVIFGDPVFGSGVLPADQNAANANAVGTQAPAGSETWVVVSGWQVYDNKGRVVEKYEPFFDGSWDYAEPTAAQSGQKATMYYDPRGRVLRTVNPDGSQQCIVYGVPGTQAVPDLTNPRKFAPTPWETYTYDANDNAGRTNPSASSTYQSHWNTPMSIVVDALGRTVKAVARNGPNPATDWYLTQSSYDIQGNLLVMTDPLGRPAFQNVYDLAKHALRIESIDAGVRRSVLDASGNPVENRDSKGALVLNARDNLNRAIRLWARDGTGRALTLRERTIYGDGSDSGLTRPQAAALNLLHKPYLQYDEAGLLTMESFDFKGKVLSKTRQVISDAVLLIPFSPPPPNWEVTAFRVDWQPAGSATLNSLASTLLDATINRTSMTYDALNRIESLLYPEDVTGNRKTCTPLYNRAGALEQVVIDGTSYLSRIAYDAKGQRSLIAYGNGLMTRYAYDPQTFRLIRLRTEGYAIPAAFTYQPIGTVFQDYAYTYDLVGNLLGLSDRTPGCGVPGTVLGTGALNRTFTYDPIYRLLSANGRECAASPASPWDDSPRCTDLTLAQNYAENYVYDPGGNISQLQHQAANGAFNRLFAFSNPSDLPVPIDNRLATMTIGQTISKYLYDDGGNLVQENTSRHFEWDHSDRMRAYRTQPGNAEPSVYAQYLYDSAGQRTKKLVRKQGGKVEVTVYVDGLFEYQSITNAGSVQKNNTLHVMDNQSRIALLRVGNPFSGDSTPAVQYQFGDHLGSSNVVVDGTGALVNREEYTPYGETSFGSFALKRYRFTGKERDEESGLAYHGARYYAPWLARWSSADPAGIVDGLNLYCYVRSNPLALVDGHGTDGTPPTPKENPSNTPPPIKQDEIPAGAADTPTGGKIIEYDSSKINEETQKSIENVQEYLGKTAEYAAQATAEGVVAAEKGAYNAVVDTAKAVVSGDPRLKRGPYAQAQLEMVLRPLDAIRATPPEGAGYLPYLGGYVLGILAPSGLAGNAEPAALEAGYVGGRNTGTGTLSFRGQQIPVRRINCAFCSIAGADAIPSTTSTSAANFEGLTEGPVKDAAAVGSLLAGRGLGSGTPDVVGSPADAHNFMTGFPEGTKFVLVYTQTAVSHAINARVGSFGLYYTDNQAFLGGLRVSFSLPSAAQVVHVFTAYNPWW